MFNSKIVCTYLYCISKYGYPPKAEDSIKYIDEMIELGFQSIELEGIREDHLSKMFESRNKVSQKLISNNISLPFFCAVLPGLTSLDKIEQQKQFDLFDKGCQIANLFGSIGILDNAPLPPYEFPENIPISRHYDVNVLGSVSLPKGITWDYIWQHIIESYKNICDIAYTYKLSYQLHPAVGVLASSADGYLNLFNALQRDNLRFNIDISNQFAMKENVNLALHRLANHIDYIHISDNSGKKVEHLSIGDGIINWDKFYETLDIINFNGHIGIDIGGAESTVDNLDSAYKNAAIHISKNWMKVNV